MGGLQSHLRMRSSYQLWVCYFLLTKRPADGLQTEKASVLEESRLGPPRRPPHRELGPHSPAGHGHVPVVFWRGATWAPEQQRWHLGSWAVGAEQPGERGWVNVQARPGRAPCHGAPGAGGQGAARRRTEARNKARTPRRPQLGDGEAARGPWHRAPRGATASRFWFIRAQWAAGVAETPFQRSAACPRPRGPALKPVSSPSLTTRRTARGQRTGRAKRQTQHLAEAAGPTAAPPQPRLVPGTARLRPYCGALGEGPR